MAKASAYLTSLTKNIIVKDNLYLLNKIIFLLYFEMELLTELIKIIQICYIKLTHCCKKAFSEVMLFSFYSTFTGRLPQLSRTSTDRTANTNALKSLRRRPFASRTATELTRNTTRATRGRAESQRHLPDWSKSIFFI